MTRCVITVCVWTSWSSAHSWDKKRNNFEVTSYFISCNLYSLFMESVPYSALCAYNKANIPLWIHTLTTTRLARCFWLKSLCFQAVVDNLVLKSFSQVSEYYQTWRIVYWELIIREEAKTALPLPEQFILSKAAVGCWKDQSFCSSVGSQRVMNADGRVQSSSLHKNTFLLKSVTKQYTKITINECFITTRSSGKK
jgi:hypothetical protein